ncbi:MAG: TrkH family potassium uptake protein [Thermodesulfovibrionales bacterium]|nr:TrkH family potassium uptake protein [Thermodesulfovibrionales bacterium]
MNIGLIFNILSSAILIISAFMLLPIVISLSYSQDDLFVLLISFLITLLTGSILYFTTFKFKKDELKKKEAFLVVTLTWLVVAFFGALPFYISGKFESLTDAYFESMAGFTTTGASILKDVESLPLGILFWRSLIQWIGGMGIIVFALAILPMLGAGGMQLFKAEVPEISVEKLKPRIIDTAKALWVIYVFLTVLNFLSLYIAGMDPFDAICHAFTTLATGGFSTKNLSIGYFDDPFIHYITAIFMFLAGINYSIYFLIYKGKLLAILKGEELRFYTLTTILATIAIMINISSLYGSMEESFRHAFFQVTSIMTTTGYSSVDFGKWHVFSQIILVIAMIFGGMIGSTAGGIKQVRILLMLKQSYREVYQIIHPRAVISLKLDDKFLDKETLGSIWGFIFLYLSLCVISSLVLSSLDIDFITSATSVISAIGNVGPALGKAGPAENYSFMPDAAKWVLTFCMLIGRLEIYTVLILLFPEYWKK